MAALGINRLRVSLIDPVFCTARRFLRRIEESDLPVPGTAFNKTTRLSVTLAWGSFEARMRVDEATGNMVIKSGAFITATVEGAVERLAHQVATTALN